MADATLARSDAASRDEELRPVERRETPISALARLIHEISDTHNAADLMRGRHRYPAFNVIHDIAYKAYADSHWPMFDMMPQDDRDLVILAGFASMMAEGLEDAYEGDDDIQRLAKGIHSALITISATLSVRCTGSVDAIRALWPDLGRSINRDIMATEILRADMEGLRHG